jgi:hypothetical protein
MSANFQRLSVAQIAKWFVLARSARQRSHSRRIDNG